MRIAFFEATEKDKEYISEKMQGHEISFFTEPLTEKNADALAGYETISIFIYSVVNREVLEKMPSVKCIATRSTGFDHIDTALCHEKNIAVLNVPFYGENTVAEHTFALILALSRNVHKSYARGLKNDFSTGGLMGFDIKGKTLGVIGTGRIGLHVIRIAKGFGMHVLAYDTNQNTFLAEVLHFNYAPFSEVLSHSDIITLHTPYNEQTHHLINQKNIGLLKKGSLLINTARGGIIENEALIYGLDQGILAGAGLDVLEGEQLIKEESECLRTDCNPSETKQKDQNKELLSRDNVVFTPHIAFYSEEALERILDTTIENLLSYESGSPKNAV